MAFKQGGNEYAISINTNDIKEAVSALAGALYFLTEEALASQDGERDQDSDFSIFARDTLGVLTRHADQLAGSEALWDGEDEAASAE